MKTRAFGTAGIRVSEVGLGTWQLGGDWGDVTEEVALETLHAAADSGVTFFDTADVYGMGRSERILGRFRAERGGEMFIATKLGRFPEPGWPGNFTRESFRAHTEASLERLGVEALDLTQLHCIPPEYMQQGDVFQWLRELHEEGKIRHFGASVESMDEAMVCLEEDGLASLQIIFNIFRRKPADLLFSKARAKGVALIVRLPLASGLLSGKFRHDTAFAETDHRSYNRDGAAFNVGETFAGLPFEKGVDLANALKPIVPEGMAMAQMALRWCLDFEAVTTIIPGAKSPEQARANAAVSDLPPLDPELHKRLEVFEEAEVREHIRGPN